MQRMWIVSLLLLGACPGKDAKVAAPAPGPGADGAASGFFDVLTVPGTRWSLSDSMSEEDPRPELVIAVADVAKVGDAQVVLLTSTVRYRPDSEPEEQPDSRWAVSASGLWMLDVDLDDAAVAAVLAEPPHWPSPPVAMDPPTGRYANLIQLADETIACIGDIPDLGGEDCPEVCGGGMCIAARGGIVQIDGDWAPDPYAIYKQDGYFRADAGE